MADRQYSHTIYQADSGYREAEAINLDDRNLDIENLNKVDKAKAKNVQEVFQAVCTKSHLPLALGVSLSVIFSNVLIGSLALHDTVRRKHNNNNNKRK